MNIIFFGTAGISKSFIENIDKKHKISAVITMPDKPAARGQQLKMPAVKTYAVENKIPCIQVEKFTDEILEQIKNYNADIGVIVSFGKIIPERIFTLPKLGCFNIHFSLLPQYRGASPVQQALIDGQTKTGVTAFYIDKGLDSGNIILQDSLCIEPDDTSCTLFDKLINLGISVMNRTLDMLDNGQCLAKPQTGTPTFCSTFKKEDGKIDWSKPADEIRNLFRGLFLWPGIFTNVAEGKLAGKSLKIIDCKTAEDNSNAQPGSIISIDKTEGFLVKCGKDALLVTKVQPESKSKMPACDFLNGAGLTKGSKFN